MNDIFMCIYICVCTYLYIWRERDRNVCIEESPITVLGLFSVLKTERYGCKQGERDRYIYVNRETETETEREI